MVCGVAVTFLLLLIASCRGQSDSVDCSRLDVDREDSGFLPGRDLSICETSSNQCCQQTYLDRIQRNAKQNLLEGLRDQLNSRFDVLQSIFNQVADYFEGDFITDFRNNIPGSMFITDISSITSEIEALLTRDRFSISTASPEINTRQIFENVIDRVEMLISTSSFLGGGERSQCVFDEIRRNVNNTGLDVLGRSLETLRRSFTGVNRIIRFLVRFNQTLDGFDADSFPTQCVERLTELSFCGRCKARIPPLCRNSCGALVRGCFAGFYTGLEGEFNNLWSVVKELVKLADRETRTILESEGLLINLNLLQLVNTCGLTLPTGRRRRQTSANNFLPESILRKVEDLSGVFQYASSGPEFCEVKSNEAALCSGERDNTEDRSCNDDKTCTSTCQCWDGSEMRETDTPAFDGISIDDQDDNPVIAIPKEVNLEIAKSRSAITNSFLTSEEFEDIIPEGLTVPPPATFTESGGVSLLVSMATLLSTVLFALLSF